MIVHFMSYLIYIWNLLVLQSSHHYDSSCRVNDQRFVAQLSASYHHRARLPLPTRLFRPYDLIGALHSYVVVPAHLPHKSLQFFPS
jgi:hypothetical protein